MGGGPIKALFKYAIVLALGLSVGFYAHGPLSFENVATVNWHDDINVIVNKALADAKPEAAVAPVDPVRAALVDEDLDYRIGQRINSLDGWRAFLAGHGNGVHAQAARAEVERLLGAAKAPAPAAMEVSDAASPDAKSGSEIAGSDPRPQGIEVAALAPDEICAPNEEGLELLRDSPTGEEARRSADQLGCEKLRPQLLGLMESGSDAASEPAALTVSDGASADAKGGSEIVGSPQPRGAEAAALTPDEICKRDADRLERLRSGNRSEEAARFASELGCEKLRPRHLGLMKSLSHAGSAKAAAPPSPSAKVGSAPGPKPPSKARETAASHSPEPERHASGCAFNSGCSWGGPSLPPILLALLGDRHKHSSASRRPPANARPNDLLGR